MLIDSAEWHFKAKDFPGEAPLIAACVHIGFFVTWAAMRKALSVEVERDWPTELGQLRNRQITPGDFVWRCFEGKISDEDFGGTFNGFVNQRYKGSSGYLAMYEKWAMTTYPGAYKVPDVWGAYDQIAFILDRLFDRWRISQVGA